jgi:hypothetical protein
MGEVVPPEGEREAEEGEAAEAAGAARAAEILPKLLPGAVPWRHKQLPESVREPILKTLSQHA